MLKYVDNILTADIYLLLRENVKWKKLSDQQAKKAIENCLYNVTVFDDEKPIGMGRIVGDGAVICYIQDLVVLPEYQKMGIGKGIMKKLIEYVESIREENSEMMLCLMCAKGRESFYESLGFIPRPTDNLGPGMITYLK